MRPQPPTQDLDPPYAVILSDIMEQADELDDDIIWESDEVEEAIPMLVRHILLIEKNYDLSKEHSLIQLFDAITRFTLDPSTLPPLNHEEEG